MSELNTLLENSVTVDEDLSNITVTVVPESPDGTPNMSDDPVVGIEDLKKQVADAETARRADQARYSETQRQLDAERQARAESDRRAAEATAHASSSEQQALENRYAQITSGLQAAKAQQGQLQDKYAELLEGGKFKEAAQIQVQIGEISARVVQYADAKEEADRYVEEMRNRPAPQQQQQQTTAPQPSVQQQRDQFLAKLHPKEAEWVRAHPRYFEDKDFQQKVAAAANYLGKVQGLTADNPDYFAKLEADVGLRAADNTRQPDNRQQDNRRQTVGAAPVNRSMPGGTGQARTYHLTQTEIEHARAVMTPDICGKDKEGRPIPPEVAYARQKERLAAQGLGPGRDEQYRPGMYRTVSRGGR